MNSFNQYQEFALSTALYPHKGDGNTVSLSYVALGLTGESGEFAEKIKKWIRGQELDKNLAAKELGDVLWYITAAAHELGYSLEDIAEMNVSKLAQRKSNNTLLGNGDER